MNELTIKRILETDVRTEDAFRGVYSRNELPIPFQHLHYTYVIPTQTTNLENTR